MKTCPNCSAHLSDDATICSECGTNLNLNSTYEKVSPEGYPVPIYPLDKFLGIMAAFGGLMGFILAYFGGEVDGKRSEYLKFYANEGLVFFLSYLLTAIPFVGWIWVIFTFVCQIIAIVNACKGIAKPVLFFGTLRIIK